MPESVIRDSFESGIVVELRSGRGIILAGGSGAMVYKDTSEAREMLADYRGKVEFWGHLFRNKELHADFTEAYLLQAKFAEVDMEGSRFVNADIREVIFEGASLRSVDMSRAEAHYAEFRNGRRSIDLRFANFAGTDLANAAFRAADLRGVENLEKAVNLDLAVFEGCRMTESQRGAIREARSERARQSLRS